MSRYTIYRVCSQDGAGMFVLTLLTHSNLIAVPCNRIDSTEMYAANDCSRLSVMKAVVTV